MTTLYDKYGGFAVINKLVQNFYGKVIASENLAPYFAATDMQSLMDHQTRFFSNILGGPVEYTGRQLKLVHAKMGITGEAFSEVAELIEEALEDLHIEASDIQTIMAIVNGVESAIVTAP